MINDVISQFFYFQKKIKSLTSILETILNYLQKFRIEF